jgi:RimJ/RimL family protein N-acetyltransferase
MNSSIIYSERLRLMPMTPSFLSASLSGKRQAAAESIGLTLSDEWFTEQRLMDIRLAQLEHDPSLQPWLLRTIALRHEPVMLGHIGFHSHPAPDYLHDFAPQGIEFGYTVYLPFRRQGYASEACAALMDWATAVHHITQFVLTIAPDNTPSQRIAQRFGFVKVGEHVDEVDGLEEIFLRIV